MTKKSTKAAKIAKMLKAGASVGDIKRTLGVSDSYIWAVKKKLAAEKAAVKAAKTTILSVDTSVYPNLKPGEFIQADTNVDAILNARASNYGTFLGLSQVTQRLKAVAHQFAGQHNKTFDADQAEALDMIFTKVGRILNGDPNYADSWTDIAGYATLVADRLQGKVR